MPTVSGFKSVKFTIENVNNEKKAYKTGFLFRKRYNEPEYDFMKGISKWIERKSF